MWGFFCGNLLERVLHAHEHLSYLAAVEKEEYGIVALSSIPMRAEASDQSEMVNQALFGEVYKVLESSMKWMRIQLQHDQYEGWIDRNQYQRIDSNEVEIALNNKVYSSESVQLLTAENPSQDSYILMGSPLPGLMNQKLILGGVNFKFEGAYSSGLLTRESLVSFALAYLNTPYLWGGRSPFGIDCSGFTQMVYRLTGVNIPRDASQQAQKGETLSFLEECEPGDLAFFDNVEGKITHVGIILNHQEIIHASGKVRIDKIDHSGIFNAEINRHTHNLRLIKRILP